MEEDWRGKYEETLERVRSLIKNDQDHVIYEHDILERFPELAPSEDERIKNGIIAYLNDAVKFIPVHIDEWVEWIERRVGQKPVFEVGDTVTDGCRTFGIVGIEDGRYIADDGDKVCFYIAHRYYTPIKSTNEPKQNWSEEDENKRNAIVGILDFQASKSSDRICATEGFLLDDLIDWLKSLRPQNRWKPSEEQIYWLKVAIDVSASKPSIQNLESLYNDLKKLL